MFNLKHRRVEKTPAGSNKPKPVGVYQTRRCFGLVFQFKHRRALLTPTGFNFKIPPGRKDTGGL